MKAAILCFPSITPPTLPQYPTGLFKIASRCSEEYDVHVIDQRITPNVFEIIDTVLNSNNVLCLGLSVMTGSQISSASIISKHYYGKIPIVWGGMHPTIFPKMCLESGFVDYVIKGEGEEAFYSLLESLSGKQVQNYLFKNSQTNDSSYNIYDNFQQTDVYVRFDKYPLNENYFIKRDGFSRAFNIESSRGCTHKCAFCHNSIWSKKYRSHKTEVIVDLINYLAVEYGIDGIIFQEDNFFLNYLRVQKLIGPLKNHPQIGWKANSRISYFKRYFNSNKQLIDDIFESGCKVLQFGIESGSSKTLSVINKKISVDDVLFVNNQLKEYPIKIRYNFIIGFPGETQKDIDDSLTLIESLISDNPYVEPPFINIYNPYPGTPMYDIALQHGFVPPDSLEEWSAFSWNITHLKHESEFKRELERISLEFSKKVKYLKGDQ